MNIRDGKCLQGALWATVLVCLAGYSGWCGSSAAFAATETEFVWGDLASAPGDSPALACNGKPGGQDTALILRWYAGSVNSIASCYSLNVYTNPEFPPGADVNGDGKLGGQDASMILQF